jgi:hypothetical protein
MHGTIVVKDSVLAEHPWVAKSLFNGFSCAKTQGVTGLVVHEIAQAQGYFERSAGRRKSACGPASTN